MHIARSMSEITPKNPVTFVVIWQKPNPHNARLTHGPTASKPQRLAALAKPSEQRTQAARATWIHALIRIAVETMSEGDSRWQVGAPSQRHEDQTWEGETGLDSARVGDGDALPLDHVAAVAEDGQQQVGDAVVQEVDLVHV